MNSLERFEKFAKEQSVDVYKVETTENIDGLYIDNNIFINEKLDTFDYKEVLGHELGHHCTQLGNNLIKKPQFKAMFEYFADCWKLKFELSLEKLAYYKINDYEIYDICELEMVKPESIQKAIDYYKSKYGNAVVETEKYKIKFYPNFKVCKIDDDFYDEY